MIVMIVIVTIVWTMAAVVGAMIATVVVKDAEVV